MDKGTYLGLISVVVMLAFLLVAVWALLPGQRKRFDEAAQLPLQDGDGMNNGRTGNE